MSRFATILHQGFPRVGVVRDDHVVLLPGGDMVSLIAGGDDALARAERIADAPRAELVVVIGKGGRSIPAVRAMDHVWGYCLANDISQRDLQRQHGGQWLKGKSIDGTTPLFLGAGDEIVTIGTGIGELRNRLVESDLVGASDVRLASADDASA